MNCAAMAEKKYFDVFSHENTHVIGYGALFEAEWWMCRINSGVLSPDGCGLSNRK